jgi:hypothetical protein
VNQLGQFGGKINYGTLSGTDVSFSFEITSLQVRSLVRFWFVSHPLFMLLY